MKITVINIFLWVFLSTLKAQDPHFTQFNMQPMHLNPALTGNFTGDFRANINYRDQWRSVSEPYTTMQFSADGRVSKSENAQFSLGAYVLTDKAGVSEFRQTMAGVNAAAGVRIGRSSSLTAGIGGGAFSQNLNPANLSWDSQYNGMQYDPSLSSNENLALQSVTKFDLHAGVVYKFMSGSTNPYFNDGVKGTLGVSAYHLTRPEQVSMLTEDAKYSRITAHADLSIGLAGTNMAIQPSFLMMLQGSQKEIMPGLLFRYLLREQSRYTGFIKSSAFTIGGYYRAGDAINIVTLFEFSNFGVGISYDINASGLTNATNGSGALELALRFITPAPNKARLNNNPLY